MFIGRCGPVWLWMVAWPGFLPQSQKQVSMMALTLCKSLLRNWIGKYDEYFPALQTVDLIISSCD